jgi:hypothetical protein
MGISTRSTSPNQSGMPGVADGRTAGLIEVIAGELELAAAAGTTGGRAATVVVAPGKAACAGETPASVRKTAVTSDNRVHSLRFTSPFLGSGRAALRLPPFFHPVRAASCPAQ